MRKPLLNQKWIKAQEWLPISTPAASFIRDGYTLSLTVTPAEATEYVSIHYTHHGNVDLAKLPIPADAKPLFAGPASAMFVCAAR